MRFGAKSIPACNFPFGSADQLANHFAVLGARNGVQVSPQRVHGLSGLSASEKRYSQIALLGTVIRRKLLYPLEHADRTRQGDQQESRTDHTDR